MARLDKQLEAWQTARDIRAFVGEARTLFAEGAGPPTEETDEYLNWALKRADDLDPLRELRAEVRDPARTSQRLPTDSDPLLHDRDEAAEDDLDDETDDTPEEALNTES